MYQKERLDSILKIVSQYGYVTVKFLSSTLHYSTATINRDLNLLEKQKLIKRSYGGVEIEENPSVPLPFRYHKHKTEKLKIGKRAAEFVKDNDIIFIDASTTSEYMTEFLTEKKDITVLTNNMALALRLSDYGVTVYCLGGKVVEPPSMLSGTDTVLTAASYKANKMFFSTGYFSEEGEIASGDTYCLLHKKMAENSEEIYYLADEEKVKNFKTGHRILFDFDKVNVVISDHEFSEETKKKFPNTRFEKV